MFGPGPACHAPGVTVFLQRDGERRASFLNRLAVLLELVIGGDDDIGAVGGDVDVQRSAEGHGAISDAVLLGVRAVVIRPLCAGAPAPCHW